MANKVTRGVRGIRQTFPANTIVGRKDGSGAPQIINIQELAAALVQTGLIAPTGANFKPPVVPGIVGTTLSVIAVITAAGDVYLA